MRVFAFFLTSCVLICAASAHGAERLTYRCAVTGGPTSESDHPFAECKGTQTARSPGGAVRVIPPPPTEIEQLQKEADERTKAIEREAKRVAERNDLRLLRDFPDEAAHRRGRQAALEPLTRDARSIDERLAQLKAARKPLTDEAEFFVGKPLPPKLKAKFDENDASAAAQKQLLQKRQAEAQQIDRRFDSELAHLKSLWAPKRP